MRVPFRRGNISPGKENIMTNVKTYLALLLAGIAAAGGAAVGLRYQREINAAREHIERMGSQVIETPCGPIEYARVGEGQPVLSIHGTFGGFDQGLLVAKPLIDAGYQVIAPSRFGYLRTPMPEHASVDQQVDAYACLLEALGIQKVAVLTVSGGAVSAIRFAARYPELVSALVLQSPAAPGEVYVAPPPRQVFPIMRSDFLYWVMATCFRPAMAGMFGVPKGSDGEVKDLLATTLPSSQRIDGFYFDNYGAATEFAEEISEASPYCVDKIKIPVLVINAVDDPVAVHANVRGLAEKFPNARLYSVPDGGHLLVGHAQEVDAQVVEFMRSCGGLFR
jgi:pimeloyl-ACP methyl ester carboxylesterase